MKQVLSVADFAIILDLVNNNIADMKFRAVNEYREENKEELYKVLEENPYYQSLVHLKNSLQNLNIEVECPDVQIEEFNRLCKEEEE